MKDRRKKERMPCKIFCSIADVLHRKETEKSELIKYINGDGEIVTMGWTPLTLSNGSVLDFSASALNIDT